MAGPRPKALAATARSGERKQPSRPDSVVVDLVVYPLTVSGIKRCVNDV